jgi:hypothetical protein
MKTLTKIVMGFAALDFILASCTSGPNSINTPQRISEPTKEQATKEPTREEIQIESLLESYGIRIDFKDTFNEVKIQFDPNYKYNDFSAFSAQKEFQPEIFSYSSHPPAHYTFFLERKELGVFKDGEYRVISDLDVIHLEDLFNFCNFKIDLGEGDYGMPPDFENRTKGDVYHAVGEISLYCEGTGAVNLWDIRDGKVTPTAIIQFDGIGHLAEEVLFYKK